MKNYYQMNVWGLEIEKVNFTATTLLFFEGCREQIEKVLVSNKISFGEKSFKYFIGYFYNDHKVKPLHVMLPKTSA